MRATRDVMDWLAIQHNVAISEMSETVTALPFTKRQRKWKSASRRATAIHELRQLAMDEYYGPHE